MLRSFHRLLVARALLYALVIVAVASASAQDQKPAVAVLRSTGAHGHLSPERVALALRLAARRLHVAGALPRMVVVLGCKQSAEVAELPKRPPGKGLKLQGAIVVESKNDHKIFYLWLLGEPTDEALAQGVVEVLVNDTGIPAKEIPSAVTNVTAGLRAQVTSAELQKSD